MRLTINFLVKKARQKSNGEIPIYVRVTLKAKRIELSTGIYCLPENQITRNAAYSFPRHVPGKNPFFQSFNNQIVNNFIDIKSFHESCRSLDFSAGRNNLVGI